ncbi:MAG: SGNH/GDSL hydrolase family protein, partial [Alphaproteobacteria bacterium]|nr:SGNH/GDSL hydrolase family protein [Alphaproteobacteria bacterium]
MLKLLQNLTASLAVGIAIAAVLLVGFELALKYVPAGQGYFLAEGGSERRAIRLPLFPPHARYVSRPPAEYLNARTEGLDARDYVIETDADGFIEPGRIHADADITVAFLGGSTTENFLVPADARFPHLAGRKLEACSGRTVNTINAGRSGITSMHSLNIFLNTVVPARPAIAVMMHNINDYAMLHHEGSYWNDHPGRSLLTTFSTVPDAREPKFVRLANLLLPRTANFVAHRFRGAAPAATDPQAARWATPKPIEAGRITRDFAKSLETFVHAARAWGVQPVLMTMPDRWPATLADASKTIHDFIDRKVFAIDDYGTFTAGFDAMNDTVRATAARLGVPLIDLATAIPPSPDLMFDAVHFNEAGSVLAADVVGQELCGFV